MKAILREEGNEHFVVKEVKLTLDGNYETAEGKCYNEGNILTIIENAKSKMAVCSACSEIIHNTKKAIENHRNMHKTYEGCLNCPSVRFRANKDDKTKYTLNDDGSFNMITKNNGRLGCGRSYSFYDIMGEKRKGVCKYNGCANAEIKPLQTFFNKYPGAFDDMITIDTIKDMKEVREHYTGYTKIKLKCRGNIYAYVNKKGIICYFEFEARYETLQVYYSKKYNKFFIYKYGKYEEITGRPSYDMTSTRWEYIKETISKLYN